METLAFVTILVTQGAQGIPEGTEFISTEPIRCSYAVDVGIAAIEEMGGRADAWCDYAYAPAKSIRPKARGEQ